MNTLYQLTLTGSIFSLLALTMTSLWSDQLSSRWHYQICRLSLLFFILPVGELVQLWRPVSAAAGTEGGAVSRAVTQAGITLIAASEKLPTVSLLAVWEFGASLCCLWHVLCWLRFQKELALARPERDWDLLALLDQVKKEVGLKQRITVLRCPGIHTPMVTGIFFPKLLLPQEDFPLPSLRYVFLHELNHLKRKDLVFQLLSCAVVILHWPNPLVYLLRRRLTVYQEFSCDELVAAPLSHEQRKCYGFTILNCCVTTTSTRAAGSGIAMASPKKQMERRLNHMLHVKEQTPLLKAIATLLLVIALLATGIVSVAAAQDVPTREELLEQLVVPTHAEIRANGYPVNELGETYGQFPDFMDEEPDLILVGDEHGNYFGYMRNSECKSPNITCPEEAVDPANGVAQVNLYLQDGVTVVGTCALG